MDTASKSTHVRSVLAEAPVVLDWIIRGAGRRKCPQAVYNAARQMEWDLKRLVAAQQQELGLEAQQ